MGIAVKYAVLASIAVRQTYYANDFCRKFEVAPALDFGVSPTTECEAVMRRFDILARRSDRTGDLVVLARVLGKNAAGEDFVRFAPSSSDKLSFWIALRNPDILNFDDLPVGADLGNLYYFTNQRTDVAAPRTDLHLAAAATGVDGVADRIPAASNDYRFHHTAPVNAGDAKVMHVLTGVAIEPAAIVNQGGQSDLCFSLQSLPLGVCRLTIGGAVQDEFYCMGPVAPRAFGVIELVLNDSIATNYRLIEADRSLAQQRPAYSIRLRNRRTRWRYSIHLRPDSPLYVEMSKLSAPDKADFLNRLGITTNDGGVTFTRQATSDTDIVFVSDAELALQEQYLTNTKKPLRLSLTKYVGLPKQTDVRSDLPFPKGPIDARVQPTIFSDAFLTL